MAFILLPVLLPKRKPIGILDNTLSLYADPNTKIRALLDEVIYSIVAVFLYNK